MTSVFFLSAEGENYPWKSGDKSRGEKNSFGFFGWKWFKKAYKDDPGRNFCWHNIFTLFRGLEFGGEFFCSIFFRENGKEEST